MYSNVEGSEFGLRNVCEGGAAGVLEMSRRFSCVFVRVVDVFVVFFCRTCGDLYTLYHLIIVSAHNGDEPPKDRAVQLLQKSEDLQLASYPSKLTQ